MFNIDVGKATQILEGINAQEKKPTKKEFDVIFVGSLDEKRRGCIESLLSAGINIQVYGPGTKNGGVYGEQLYNLYRKSRIILNITREGSGFSLRVMEAMSSGSMLLSEFSDDLKRYFIRGEHLDWYKTPQEAIRLIKKYLSNDKERERIADKGRAIVENEFTWDAQAENICSLLGI